MMKSLPLLMSTTSSWFSRVYGTSGTDVPLRELVVPGAAGPAACMPDGLELKDALNEGIA
jgi:hypothetical protein